MDGEVDTFPATPLSDVHIRHNMDVLEICEQIIERDLIVGTSSTTKIFIALPIYLPTIRWHPIFLLMLFTFPTKECPPGWRVHIIFTIQRFIGHNSAF